MTKLFNYLAEYLINFDGAKERAELLRLEKEKEKEAQVKAGGVAAEMPEKNEDAEEDENHDEDEEIEMQSDQEIDGASDDMEVDEAEEDSMAVEDYVEDEKPDHAKVADSPWPLNLLAYLARFGMHIRSIYITLLMTVMLRLY